MYKKLCFFLLSAILLSGCNSDETQQIGTNASLSGSDIQEIVYSTTEGELTFSDELTSEETEKIYLRNFPTYDEIKAQYPDKTVLVWSFDGNMFDNRRNIRTRELNAYLDRQGYDFALCFEVANTLLSDDKYAYIKYIRNKVDSSEPVDIICNSARFVTASRAEGIPPYNAAVYEKIMEPLDTYLEGQSGQELYRLMPENFWRSLEIDGKVYGFNGCFNQLSEDFGYYANKQLTDQYGFDIEKPISDQIDILKSIKENENIDIVAAPNIDKKTEADSFGAPRQVTDGVCIDNGEIKSVLDSESYKETLRLFNTLLSNGLLSYTSLADTHRESAFIITDSRQAGAVAYKDRESVWIDYYGTEIECIPVFGENTLIKTAAVATGICAYSKNKEKAFEALSLIMTDPYINNLLSYGIWGEDYTLYGNRAVLDPAHGHPFGELRFSNKILCFSAESDYENAAEIYTDAFNNGNTKDLGFVFDGREVENEIIAVTAVIQKDLSKLLIAKDFDGEIENIKQSLREAGLDTVIDQCKKQYADWKMGEINE
ncbi:MAG: DUF3502 domain-containing protein [Ruminococcaceae bacterium]|nr:DUF3502 domain-containing protein [Oscillospiraceae bacterium]